MLIKRRMSAAAGALGKDGVDSDSSGDDSDSDDEENVRTRMTNGELVLAQLIKVLFVIVGFLYITITRAALGVFNCYYPEPFYGTTFMVDEPLEPCWKGPNTLQGRMMLPAILVLVFYTLGYPIFVITLFHFKRKTIYDDQMLRARGMGRTFSSNPHFRFRMQFGRLYSHFRPSHFYWLLIVIMRKFVLCVAAVSYKENVMFQLALLLLAIFLVLLIHVKANPFMDIQERAQLILDQSMGMLSKEMALMRHMQKLSASPAAMRQLEAKIEDTQNQIKLQQIVLHDHHVLLWNLNSVETVMDAGMIMVLPQASRSIRRTFKGSAG